MDAIQQFSQTVILASGALSVCMTQSSHRAWRRWACVVGIIGQPWWIASAWSTGSWGMLGVSVIITCAWSVGVYRLARRVIYRQDGLDTASKRVSNEGTATRLAGPGAGAGRGP